MRHWYKWMTHIVVACLVPSGWGGGCVAGGGGVAGWGGGGCPRSYLRAPTKAEFAFESASL